MPGGCPAAKTQLALFGVGGISVVAKPITPQLWFGGTTLISYWRFAKPTPFHRRVLAMKLAGMQENVIAEHTNTTPRQVQIAWILIRRSLKRYVLDTQMGQWYFCFCEDAGIR